MRKINFAESTVPHVAVRSGQVLLDGGMIARMPAAEVAKQMAILPQGPQAPGGLTVAELVAYGRYPHQKGSEDSGRKTMRPLTGHWR